MFDALQEILNPVAFRIPIGENGFPIYWYGILIAVGIGLGAWWASREIEKRGQSSDEFFNGLLLVIIIGYIGARLGYVAQDWLNGGQYNSFWEVINIRSGGVNILWGFLIAVLAGVWFARSRRLRLWHYADVTGPTILLAQGIGRWGNFINQELYGPPTGSSTWGLLIEDRFRIPPFNDLQAYPLDTRFHPTFFYESLALLVGFVVLVVLNNRFRDKWSPGTLFALFLIWWGGNRTWIEFFRPDQPNIGSTPLTYSMIVAFAITLGGVYLLLQRTGRLPQSERGRRSRTAKPKRRRDTEPTP